MAASGNRLGAQDADSKPIAKRVSRMQLRFDCHEPLASGTVAG